MGLTQMGTMKTGSKVRCTSKNFFVLVVFVVVVDVVAVVVVLLTAWNVLAAFNTFSLGIATTATSDYVIWSHSEVGLK